MKEVNKMEILIEKLITGLSFLSLGQIMTIAIFLMALNSSKTMEEFEKKIYFKIKVIFWLFVMMLIISLLYFT